MKRPALAFCQGGFFAQEWVRAEIQYKLAVEEGCGWIMHRFVQKPAASCSKAAAA